MSSIGWNMMVKWYETHRNTWKSLLFLWHQNCCLLVLSKAFPKPASSICWCCQWCRCVFCFWKNPCVSRCVAWQRYHDCTLLQRASAFIACSNLREEDFLFFLGSNIFIFFDSNGWSPPESRSYEQLKRAIQQQFATALRSLAVVCLNLNALKFPWNTWSIHPENYKKTT